MVKQDRDILAKLTDHTPLHTRLPIHYTRPLPRQQQSATPPKVVYKWVEGTSVFNYSDSAKTWRDYTHTDEFRTALLTIVDDTSLSNEARSQAVESFLLQQALEAGVVVKREIREPSNPNKL